VAGLSGNQLQAGAGNLYIPVWCDDVDIATSDAGVSDRRIFLQCRGDRTKGVRITLDKTVATSNVFTIQAIEAGRLYPAWYAAYTPDNQHAGLSDGSPVANNKYWNADVGEYAEWDLPAKAAGMDRIVLSTFDVLADDGEITVKINGTVVGTKDTGVGSGSDRGVLTTIELTTATAENDVIRLENTGTDNARFHGVYLYDSTGTVNGADTHRHMVDSELSDIHVTSSGMEFAAVLAPTGSGGKWAGSFAHQSADDYDPNCAQIFDTGQAYSLTGDTFGVGYMQGNLKLHRDTTVRYDATPTDLGILNETYSIFGDCLIYDWDFVASQALDVGDRSWYGGMLPLPSTAEKLLDETGVVHDCTSLSDGDQPIIGRPLLIRGVGGLGGYSPVMQYHPGREVEHLFVVNTAGTKLKSYWRLRTGRPGDSAGALANNETIRGGWTYWVEA
jgi:hypothetical protein